MKKGVAKENTGAMKPRPFGTGHMSNHVNLDKVEATVVDIPMLQTGASFDTLQPQLQHSTKINKQPNSAGHFRVVASLDAVGELARAAARALMANFPKSE